MRCFHAIVVALASVIAAATLAHGAIYVWHDTQGVTHYVDSLDNVPTEYREAATLLVKDWERPAPPRAEDVAPSPVAPVGPRADPIGSYEEGLWAGWETALATQPPPVNVSFGSIVQNVQVVEPPESISAFPLFGPVFLRGPHRKRPFVPTVHERFIRGPAGPPPLGAAGPPPLGAAGPSPVFVFRR